MKKGGGGGADNSKKYEARERGKAQSGYLVFSAWKEKKAREKGRKRKE